MVVSLNVEKEIIPFLTDFFFLECERIPPNSFIMIDTVVILRADQNSSRNNYKHRGM